MKRRAFYAILGVLALTSFGVVFFLHAKRPLIAAQKPDSVLTILPTMTVEDLMKDRATMRAILSKCSADPGRSSNEADCLNAEIAIERLVRDAESADEKRRRVLGIPPYNGLAGGDASIKGNVVDTLLAAFPKATAVVTAPKEVTQYEPFTISARLSTGDLSKYSVEATNSKHQVRAEIADVSIAPRMQATLRSDFKLAEGQNATIAQAASAISENSWSWRVLSETSGRDLKAEVSFAVLLKVEGAESAKPLGTGIASVYVHVNPLGWAERHWEWVASSLVIPLAGWLVPKVLPGKGGPAAPNQSIRRFAALLKRRRV